MTHPNRWRQSLMVMAFLLPALLLLAACGSDDDADDLPTPTEDPGQVVPTPEPDPTPTVVVDDADDEPTEPDPTATPEPVVEPTPTPDDEADDPGMRTVLVYLIRNEEIAVASRTIAGTPQVATGAINELLTGLTPYEEDLGFSTAIPDETRLLGIAIHDDGTAIVDLTGDFEAGGGSFSMRMRVAQIVFTMTQFSTVDRVQIRLDGVDVEAIGGEGVIVGEPQTRDDFEDLSPAILVESPTPGKEVSSPINLRGTSNTFEATMLYEIIDNTGTVIYSDFGTATSGTGTRGEFDFMLDVPIEAEGFGMLVVFEESARDGSRINVIEIPIDLRR
jgi:germination protein M